MPPCEINTAQKIKFSIKDFFSNCDQIRKKLWIWSHLMKKSLMENFIFCAVRFEEINQKNIHSAEVHILNAAWNNKANLVA